MPEYFNFDEVGMKSVAISASLLFVSQEPSARARPRTALAAANSAGCSHPSRDATQ